MTGVEVVLSDKWTDRQAVRAIKGARYDSEKGAYVFDPEADPKATLVAVRLFPNLRSEIPQALLEGVTAPQDTRPPNFAPEWATAAQEAGHTLLSNVDDEPYDLLYDYQKQDCAYLAARMKQDGGAYLGWDRGLGKTLGALIMAQEVGARRIIIVTPNSSKDTVWTPEVQKWYGYLYEDRVYNVAGTKSKRDRAVAEFVHAPGPAILLVHYEALRLIDWSKVPDVDLVIVDEAHRLSNGSASAKSPKFYKALKKIGTKHKLALSGSIIVNSPEDFFGAQHWLFPKKYRSQFKDWRDKYLQYVESGWGKVLIGVLPDKLEAMKTELASFMCVREKRDELPGLPDKVTVDLRVPLSAMQRKVYDDMAERFLAELPDGVEIKAGNVVTQLTRLRQIAAGLDVAGSSVQDSVKIDTALDLVMDNLPKKTVVFTWHRATATAIGARLDALGVKHRVITGDTKMSTRAISVQEFQTDPEVKVIVATIKTLGESVTLHAASDLIFVESSWTPADMAQAADRVYRIGQNDRVSITNVIAADTVDETRVLPTLLDKAAMRRMVLGGSE